MALDASSNRVSYGIFLIDLTTGTIEIEKNEQVQQTTNSITLGPTIATDLKLYCFTT